MKRERSAGQGREVYNVGTEGMGHNLEVDPDRVQGREGPERTGSLWPEQLTPDLAGPLWRPEVQTKIIPADPMHLNAAGREVTDVFLSSPSM